MARMTVPEYNETIVANGSNDLDSTDQSGAGGAPLAPTAFTAVYLSDTSLSLAWTDNATNELNYELDRSPNGVDTWTALTNPAANATSATDTGRTVDTTYYYRLRAVNASGNSSYATANGTTTVPVDDGQLASGHYVDRFFNMSAVYPRPDGETGSYAGTVIARHRWAYYDATNPIQYEVPLKVFGGAAPNWYTIIAAPTGATIVNTYGDASAHSVLKWTPTQAYTTGSPATFTIRVHGQDAETLDITWTCATSSSTNQFIFLDSAATDDTGTGAIGDPFKTLTHIMGSTITDTTFPNRIVYMRTGTYATEPHSDGWIRTGESVSDRVKIDSAYNPATYLSYPSEAVTINFANAEIYMEDAASDVLFSGSSTAQLIINGSATGTAETHNFWIGNNSKRWGFEFVSFDGFIPRVAGNYTNSVPIFSPGSNPTPTRQYGHFHNVGEINRTQTSANDGLVSVLFGLQYFADEYTFGTRTGGPGMSFKDTCLSTSTRYSDLSALGESFVLALAGQNGSHNQEVVFSKLAGSLFFNAQANAATTNLKEARNTIYATNSNYQEAVRAWSGSGGFESINSALVSNGPLQINANITASGEEAQGDNGSGNLPFNTTTLLLENTGTTNWRDLYLGTRGHEIE